MSGITKQPEVGAILVQVPIGFSLPENKLKRLQTKSGVLQQLKDRREHCIETLLASDSPVEQRISDLELDQPVSASVARFIHPEQPLTVGEVLHLVKHDELENTETEGEVEPKEISSSSSESTATNTPPPSR